MGQATITYTVVDSKNERSVMKMHVPDTFALANVLAFAGDVALLIDPLIGGFIINIGLVYDVSLPAGLDSAAEADTDVEEGARFSWVTSLGNFSRFRIPTFRETLIASDSKAVDILDTDVVALINAVVNGLSETEDGTEQVAPCDGRGEDIVSLNTAREAFAKDRG